MFIKSLGVFVAYLYTAAAALLTPEQIYVCPSGRVLFTCVIPRNQSNNLRWNINFMHQSTISIERHFITSLDGPGSTQNARNNFEQLVTFRLNSVSPLINSTMTATIKNNPEFRQVSIKCNDGSATFRESEISTIFIVTQAPTLDSNMTLSVRDYQDQWLLLQVNWIQYISPAQYSVFWASANESRVATTFNNSVQLLLSYNSEYNISVVAANCGGSSHPISVLLKVGRCSPPVVDPNVIIEGDINCVEGSRISYHCQSGLEPTESKVSTCLSSGIWSPNPAEHNCTTQPDLELSCDIPIIKKNVIMESEQNFMVGSVVVYYCNGSSPNTDATTSVCTERGKWIPNPAEYTCDGSQLNSKGWITFTAAVIASVVTFILYTIGVLTFSIIALRYKHVKKQTTVVKSEDDVVYDEICIVGPTPLATHFTLNENTAYSTKEVPCTESEDEYVTMVNADTKYN